jgi:outer membrane PBP1 activator LpoA protein
MFSQLVLRLSLPALMALGLALSASTFAVDDIAVLLPQKGRLTQVGQSIRDGVLAAYYQDSQSHPDSPRLRFYDSADVPAPELVATAAQQGADVIIGPLDRDQVQSLLTCREPAPHGNRP